MFKVSEWILSFPTNTSEVERSIWRYNAILAKDRQSLKEDNIRSLNFVQFNDKYFSKIKQPVVFNENEVMEIEYQEIQDSSIDQELDLSGIDPIENNE